MKLGDKEHRALKPDAQAFDEIRIVTIPRFKESGLSGDEWRISAAVQFYRKGQLVHESGTYRDVHTACGYLYSEHGNATDNGKGYFAGEGDICDQEGCCEKATVKLYKKFEYCREGHKSDPLWPTYRMFCDRHKDRGDQSFDDSNSNYKDAP